MEKQKNPIEKMQKYLQSLRKINGWTAEDVGTRIGVTKQTISNLENNKVSMTKTQYIAIRSVFECAIRENKSNDVLRRIFYVLFYLDRPDWNEDALSEVLDTLAAASFGGVSRTQLSVLAMTLLAPIVPLNGVNINFEIEKTVPYTWIAEVQNEEKDNANN